jgi:hypothetical protein
MKKTIIGGIITLVIGGTGFTVSQTDIVKNFASETGMSSQQAEQYVSDAQTNLESFSKLGQDLVSDGNSVLGKAGEIDCATYTYGWEAADLSCPEGASELSTIGNSEVKLGNCYSALGEDLGDAAKPKISECIDDIDAVNSSYSLPIAVKVIQTDKMSEIKNTNLYNKSVLKAALESK